MEKVDLKLIVRIVNLMNAESNNEEIIRKKVLTMHCHGTSSKKFYW